ncbi:hypothetical protein LCGC14_0617560 [marine sediment metagenome]|uniref:Uncharacterized protein n=1 Tax=marine sediment metagenome TaxID=412755 RepID=A0A0F9RAM3_9ZZZZ
MTEEIYSSPLKDELNLDTDTFGTGIIVAYDKRNKRALLDIPMGKRLKISQSGNSMLIANGRFDFNNLKGTVQMNINVWDKSFSKDEMPKLKEHMAIKKQQADLKQQMNDLNQ